MDPNYTGLILLGYAMDIDQRFHHDLPDVNTGKLFFEQGVEANVLLHVRPKNDPSTYHLKEWSVGPARKFLLAYMGAQELSRTQELLVTEFAEFTLSDFLKRDDFCFRVGSVTRSRHLSPALANYLRDVLNAILYIMFKLSGYHGNICAKNIFLGPSVGTMAKLGIFNINNRKVDIYTYCQMIKKEVLNRCPNDELQCFIDSLQVQQAPYSHPIVRNSINNPILFDPEQRVKYRSSSWLKLQDVKKSETDRYQFFVDELKTRLRRVKVHWVESIRVEKNNREPINICAWDCLTYKYIMENNEEEKNEEEDDRKVPYQSYAPLDFLRFSRNLYQHYSFLGFEALDDYCTGQYPHYLGVFHKLMSENMFFIATNHADGREYL